MGKDRSHLQLLRVSGFSLYWAWLFLFATSPSPLFGMVYLTDYLSFGTLEMVFRLAALVGVVLVAPKERMHFTNVGITATCMVLGPLSVVLLFAFPQAAIVPSAVLAGIADVVMLLTWLCYFGYGRVGNTAVLIAASYAAGSVVCLVASALGAVFCFAAACLSPFASGVLFLLALHCARPDTTASEECPPAKGEPARLNEGRPRYPASDMRMMYALGLYAFAFSLFSCLILQRESIPGGSLLQAIGCVAICAVVVLMARLRGADKGLYSIYRVLPILFTLGLVALLATDMFLEALPLSGVLVAFAYNTFEALAYNDFANMGKIRGMHLLEPMARLRLTATLGMLTGGILGIAACAFTSDGAQIRIICASLGLVSVVVASTLVFTERQLRGLSSIAVKRAREERSERAVDKASLVPLYASERGLSNRETEVLHFLIEGRTMLYAADKLYIAESTVRTHVHNVYKKTGTHNRMELLDDFEQFCSKRSKRESDR